MDLLVISTLSCILDTIAPFFIRFISSHMLAQKRYDVELRKELNNLKENMARLSMVDEFAKYAKLQRRCNHAENTLKENMNQRLNQKLKLQLLLIYSVRALNGMFILWLLYMYKNEPVIILSENVLWPIQNFLSWPCQHENAISLLVWLAIIRLGISACKTLHV
ncbi:PREDICTED: tail-anchored protein insertion receptor WRB-like [Wasmannia auropunctata]|uniref:tail-anchored protein insertion receptor WRB-like n=1 Tax=Wasmannia auropunctata TaxID=64793 RepID=UPI0005EF30F5|nr:PREDICTED: tail-anchored protein insertion receptor WRB-like [Wasmannia auropunctata]